MKFHPKFNTLCESSKRHGEKNDCAVKAVALAADRHYDEAHEALRKLGRRNRQGTYIHQTLAAIKTFGCDVVDVTDRFRGAKTNISAKKVLPRKGTFLIRNPRHILAMVDGEIIDWSDGRRKRVDRIYQVLPSKMAPVVVPAETVKPKPTSSTFTRVRNSIEARKFLGGVSMKRIAPGIYETSTHRVEKHGNCDWRIFQK